MPGVGWVFLLRTPVRGPASRRSVREAKTGRDGKAARPRAAPAHRGPRRAEPARSRRRARGAAAPSDVGRRAGDRGRAKRRGRTSARNDAPPSRNVEPINEPLPFIEFVANHPVGSTLDGTVEQFASHGAYVVASGARCYVPLKSMGDPRTARAHATSCRVGETFTFTVVVVRHAAPRHRPRARRSSRDDAAQRRRRRCRRRTRDASSRPVDDVSRRRGRRPRASSRRSDDRDESDVDDVDRTSSDARHARPARRSSESQHIACHRWYNFNK